jgi:hypothetical protein
VNNARDCIFLRCFDWKNKSLGSLGNEVFLNRIGFTLQNTLQNCMDEIAQVPLLFSDAAQFGSGTVHNLPPLVNTTVDFLLQFRIGSQFCNQIIQDCQVSVLIDHSPQSSHACQSGRDRKQLFSRKNSLSPCSFQRLANILDAFKA